MALRDRLLKAVQALTSGDDDAKSGDSEDRGDVAPSSAMMQVLQRAGLAEPTEEKPRALFHDPYSVMDWGGWRERPNAVTYDTLRQMSQKHTAIAAIVQVRVNQVAAFAKPQQGRYDRGFRVILRDRRDQKRAMSRQEALQAASIERMLETTGILLPSERPADRDSFRDFLKKAVRDILVYDQWCFEKQRDRNGRVSRFIALPSETIRPAVADIEHIEAGEMRQRVSHVQVYEDTVIAEFSPDDIAWCVMNPRSDLRVNTFGFSPVEQLTQLVTAWLFGFEYNQRFFTQGANIKGVLNIKGAIPDRQLKAFRRLWYSMVSGVNNAWRTPILNSEDIQWINMHANNAEMEYGAWMDWLTKLTCAVFGMDPMEINFQFGNTGQKAAMQSARPNEDEVTESKDKGLTPLMEYIEDQINRHIVWDLNPDFELAFTGLNAREEKTQREAWTAEAKSYKTVDEVRAEMDLAPLPDKKGEVVLDSVWLQNAQQAGAGAGGGPGEGAPGKPLDEIPEGEEGEGDQENDDSELPGEGFEEEDTQGEQDTSEDNSADAGSDSGTEINASDVEEASKSLDGALLQLDVLIKGEPLRKSYKGKRRQYFDIDLGD